MMAEVLRFLAVLPEENFIDATVGLAGHAREILKCNAPTGKLLAIDRDGEAVQSVKEILPPERAIVIQSNFVELEKIVDDCRFQPVDGILFDLGFSSVQIDDPSRGFSFRQDAPLDMRYDQSQQLTAEEIVNKFSIEKLTQIFREYGDERYAKKIAESIVRVRQRQPIRSTNQLAGIVEDVCRQARGYHRQKIHPATRVFQALRIAVNDELESLKKGLAVALDILSEGGRIVVISFHSGEDRIVKNFFRDHRDKLEILTKKPVRPSPAEVAANPRSRSARLRAARIKIQISNLKS